MRESTYLVPGIVHEYYEYSLRLCGCVSHAYRFSVWECCTSTLGSCSRRFGLKSAAPLPTLPYLSPAW